MVAPQGLDVLQGWVTTSLQGVRPDRHAAPDILPSREDVQQVEPGLLPPEEEAQAVAAAAGQTSPQTTAVSAADALLLAATTPAAHAEMQSGSSGSRLDADGPQSQQPLMYGGDSWPEWRYNGDSGEEGFSSLVSPGQLGLLYLVRPQRELREVELRWFLPYGSMKDARCGGEGITFIQMAESFPGL